MTGSVAHERLVPCEYCSLESAFCPSAPRQSPWFSLRFSHPLELFVKVARQGHALQQSVSLPRQLFAVAVAFELPFSVETARLGDDLFDLPQAGQPFRDQLVKPVEFPKTQPRAQDIHWRRVCAGPCYSGQLA
jgi:hypothetical protein